MTECVDTECCTAGEPRYYWLDAASQLPTIDKLPCGAAHRFLWAAWRGHPERRAPEPTCHNDPRTKPKLRRNAVGLTTQPTKNDVLRHTDVRLLWAECLVAPDIIEDTNEVAIQIGSHKLAQLPRFVLGLGNDLRLRGLPLCLSQ